MRNGPWWKGHIEVYVVLLALIATGLISPVISLTIQECVVDNIEETDNRGTRPEVPLSKWKEATQYDNPQSGDDLVTESVTASVRPTVCKRTNVIVVVPRKTTDHQVNCPVNVILTPQVNVQNSLCAETQAEEWFLEEPEVIREKWPRRPVQGIWQIISP